MWVARDMYGSLNLFEDKPDRCDKVGGNFPGDETFNIHPCTWRIKNPYGGFNISGFVEINKDLFPNLKWEDEPTEEVVIDNLDNLILKFEILNTQFQTSPESVGQKFEDFAKKNWNNVDLNYFDDIM